MIIRVRGNVGEVCMMICNICGYQVVYQSDNKKWVCSGCSAVDPPIQVQPFRSGRQMDLFSIDANLMIKRPRSNTVISTDSELSELLEEDVIEKPDKFPPEKRKEKSTLFRS